MILEFWKTDKVFHFCCRLSVGRIRLRIRPHNNGRSLEFRLERLLRHLRRKIAKIVSQCRASKSRSVGIALQDFLRTVEANDLSLVRRSREFFCKQACPSWSYDRHMSLVQLLTSPVRQRTEVFKSRGLSASVSFVCNRSLVFLCSPTPRKRLLRRQTERAGLKGDTCI